MSRKNNRELLSSSNNGWGFEAAMAIMKHWKRDGRPGSYDLTNKNRVYECKFFTIKEATAKRNAVYNSAHGFKAKKNVSLHKQVEDYCHGFTHLLVGYGESVENFEYFVLTSEEAVEWLYKRLQHKANSDEIRFCWGGKSLESRYPARLAKLQKEGYKL